MSFSENFINIMDAIGEKIGIVIDWTSSNIMPYMEKLCGRIVNYEMFTSIAWLVFATILLIIGIVIVSKGIKHMKNPERSYYNDTFIIPMIIGGSLIGTSIIMFIFNIDNVITCLTLPEKTIIQFIMRYK